METEDYGWKCHKKLQAIGKAINVPEMTHKEFVRIVKSSPFCRPAKRVYHECPICKRLGIPQRRY